MNCFIKYMYTNIKYEIICNMIHIMKQLLNGDNQITGRKMMGDRNEERIWEANNAVIYRWMKDLCKQTVNMVIGTTHCNGLEFSLSIVAIPLLVSFCPFPQHFKYIISCLYMDNKIWYVTIYKLAHRAFKYVALLLAAVVHLIT